MKPIGPNKSEFITADKFIPISFADDGKPRDIGFLTTKRIGENNYYTRFERHYLDDNGNLTVLNKCYHSQDTSDIGQICSLEEVPEWAEINPGPVTYPGMQQMDFGYYRNPIKNKVDQGVEYLSSMRHGSGFEKQISVDHSSTGNISPESAQSMWITGL